MYNSKISQSFRDYYDNTQYNRYSQFLIRLVVREGISTDTIFDFFQSIAYLYVGESDDVIMNLLATAFSGILRYKTYDRNLWGTPIANAFATKMCNLIGEGD